MSEAREAEHPLCHSFVKPANMFAESRIVPSATTPIHLMIVKVKSFFLTWRQCGDEVKAIELLVTTKKGVVGLARRFPLSCGGHYKNGFVGTPCRRYAKLRIH